MANRRLEDHVPEDCKLGYLVTRLYKRFRECPNTIIDWEEDARDYCEGLALVENISAYRCRFIDRNPEEAAGHGIVPMQVGIVAPLLALLDYGAGNESNVREFRNDRPVITTCLGHAKRAKALVTLSLGIKERRGNDEPDNHEAGHADSNPGADTLPLPPAQSDAMLMEVELRESDIMRKTFKKLLEQAPEYFNRAYVATQEFYQRGDRQGTRAEKESRLDSCIDVAVRWGALCLIMEA